MRAGRRYEHGPPGNVPGAVAEAGNRRSQGATTSCGAPPTEASDSETNSTDNGCAQSSRAGDSGAGPTSRCKNRARYDETIIEYPPE